MQTMLRQAMRIAEAKGFGNLTNMKKMFVSTLLKDILCIFEENASFTFNPAFKNTLFYTTKDVDALTVDILEEYKSVLSELRNYEFSIDEDEYLSKVTPSAFQDLYYKLYYLSLEDDNEKSKLGVYYTTKDLAEYIAIESLRSYFNEICNNLGDNVRFKLFQGEKSGVNNSITNAQVNIIKECIKNTKVLDLCSGCGQLIISFLKYIDNLIGIVDSDIDIIDFIESNITAIDIDELAISILKLRLSFFSYIRTKNNKPIDLTNILLNDALDVDNYKGNTYDIIISNPPYVSSKNFNKKIITERKLICEYYNQHLNLYGYFFLVGISMAKEKGVLSFLNPNTLLTENSFEKVREAIYLNTKFTEVLQLPLDHFEKNLKPIIITLTKIQELEYGVIERKLNNGSLADIYNSLKIINLKSNYIYKDNFEIRFYPENIDRIISKMQSNYKDKLNKYLEIKQGLDTITSASIMVGSDKSIIKYLINMEDVTNKATRDDEIEGIPKFYYLDKKIVVKRRGVKDFNFALDTSKYVWKSNIIVLYPIDFSTNFDVEFFLAILNSRLIGFWLKNKASQSKGEYSLTKQILEGIPVVYDKISSINITSKIKEFLHSKDISIIQQIDNLIYQLYGLTEEEINIVKNYY
ncbi:Eco57I restriction-modification methylase domain-containing protein [Clostridium swellfunianum]|uniref:Eco57I restriction-modification methylase domain-containing protein n=1 Tax=Clostridium swellfunianum TaxID=1367462 RepID=UPI002030FB22|nr:TaqI-like C-terminal specificity domain-containing protein [Clostridium swellfunianum]MCM0647247.1 Eco57I restriction-modification methylase domain-containing protein [Clostridium swellfunianum]